MEKFAKGKEQIDFVQLLGTKYQSGVLKSVPPSD
jgi:hypothetical protein